MACTIIKIEDRNRMLIGRFKIGEHLDLGDINEHEGFINIGSTLNRDLDNPNGCEMITLRTKGTIVSERASMKIGDEEKGYRGF